MEQMQQFDQNQDQVLDQEIGKWTTNLVFTVSSETTIGVIFTEFLKNRNRLDEFDKMSEKCRVGIDGVSVLNEKGFHAKVSEILRTTVKPTQKVGIFPYVAGG